MCWCAIKKLLTHSRRVWSVDSVCVHCSQLVTSSMLAVCIHVMIRWSVVCYQSVLDVSAVWWHWPVALSFPHLFFLFLGIGNAHMSFPGTRESSVRALLMLQTQWEVSSFRLPLTCYVQWLRMFHLDGGNLEFRLKAIVVLLEINEVDGGSLEVRFSVPILTIHFLGCDATVVAFALLLPLLQLDFHLSSDLLIPVQ